MCMCTPHNLSSAAFHLPHRHNSAAFVQQSIMMPRSPQKGCFIWRIALLKDEPMAEGYWAKTKKSVDYPLCVPWPLMQHSTCLKTPNEAQSKMVIGRFGNFIRKSARNIKVTKRHSLDAIDPPWQSCLSRMRLVHAPLSFFGQALQDHNLLGSSSWSG